MQKRWWFCHATDFQSFMYPCFICCRIFGIFPYKINASTFEASKPRYILASVVTCVCSVINMAFIYNIIISRIHFGDGLTWNLYAIIYYILSGFIVIISHILSGPSMNLLQTIWEISSKLPPETYQKLSRLIHVKDILGIILTVVQTCISFSKLRTFEFNSFLVLHCSLMAVGTTYSALLMLATVTIYLNCVYILRACFKRINDNLVGIQRLVVNEVKPSVPRFICHVQRNELLLTKLKALKKRHQMISNAVQQLNKLFSPQLLTTIILAFSAITFDLYFYIVRWQDGAFITFDIQFVDVLLASVVYNVIKISILVWAYETSKNEAQKIGTNIHDLINCTRDETIKYELQLFSLQVLHCEKTFSAKCLTVDATLLAAIVGNITTYLLILIQFLNMSHSCDGKAEVSVTQ